MNRLRLLCALLLSSFLLVAADAARAADELIGDPKVIGSLDRAKTREAGLRATAAAEKIGWRIGSQAYTLREQSLLDTLDTLYILGLNNVECYPNQQVSKEFKDAKGKPVNFGPGMSEEAIAAVKKKLDQTGIKVLSMGVTGIPADEAGARKYFEFAKTFGMERLVTEVKETQFPILEKLGEEYHVDVALHNHPNPSYYWDPAHVLKAVQGYKHIGSCADVGHWQRSKVNPIDALKMLEGHIFESHFKDLNEFGNVKAHDLPWGTGTGNARGMLEECYRQTKAGDLGGETKKMTFNIEYEIGHGTELVENMAKCIDWFGQQCEELSKK